jgi:hypothetical protein
MLSIFVTTRQNSNKFDFALAVPKIRVKKETGFGKKLYLCSGFKYVQNNIDMANVVTIPSQGQILVNIEDMSMLKDIKKAISLLKGVGKITVPRTKRLSSYERSLRDLDEGRVYDYDSLDDLIKEIEG